MVFHQIKTELISNQPIKNKYATTKFEKKSEKGLIQKLSVHFLQNASSLTQYHESLETFATKSNQPQLKFLQKHG